MTKFRLALIVGSIVLSISIFTFLFNKQLHTLIDPTIQILPTVFNIEITELGICDGNSIDSYPDQVVSQDDFRNNAVYICGYLKNNTPILRARPIFRIMPEEGVAIWYQTQLFSFEADYFYTPIKNIAPEVGTYTITVNRARNTLYEAEFTVVP